MSRLGPTGPIAWRELSTVVRTRSYLFLSGGLAVVFGGVIHAGGTDGGYVPVAVDLLLPLELLVPLVAVALGYRAFGGDNDDRPVLLSYPVSKRSLALGVFAGRLVGLTAIVGIPLGLVGVVVPRGGGTASRVFATHGGSDSPVLFVRFLALTICFGAVVLAMAMAASVLVRTSRAALAAALGVLVAVVAGGDLAALAGLTTGRISGDALGTVLAASPNAAYRGLVLETVVGAVADQGDPVDGPAAVAGLTGWLLGSLAVVVAGLERQPLSGIRDRLRRAFRRVIDAFDG